MTLERTATYPYPHQLSSIEDVRKYLIQLHNGLAGEATTRVADFDILKLSNVSWVDVRTFGVRAGGTAAVNTAGVQAAIDSLALGGIIFFPRGTYALSDTLAVVTSGYLFLGEEKSRTILDFSTIDGAKNSITFADGLIDIGFEYLTITGRASGAGSEIVFLGSHQNIGFKNVAITSGGTGSCLKVTTSTVMSNFERVFTDGGAYGIELPAAATSTGLRNCWTNNATTAGYWIKGTYIGLHDCAADGNAIGYLIDTCEQVSIINCGAEISTANAAVVNASNGVTFIEFRGWSNNTDAAAIPAHIDIKGSSDYVTIIGGWDIDSHASSSCSIGSSDTTAGTSTVLINPRLEQGMDATITARTVFSAGGLYINGDIFVNNNAIWFRAATNYIHSPATSVLAFITAGSERLRIDADGHLLPGADDTHYIGKNDDDSPAAWKGVILKDTNDGKYYRIEVTNGSVVATDLSD